MKRYLLSHDEISTLCLELSMLIHAGADCASGFALLALETEDGHLCALLNDMARKMDEGVPLARVVEESEAFPRDVSAMLRIGESTGRTEEALNALARYHDTRSQADSRLRSALLYPSVLLLVMLAVIVVLLTQVLPIFNDVYASLGGQLTGLAGGLLELGRWLNTILPVLCVLLAFLVIALILFSCSERVRAWLIGKWQKHRGDKGLTRKMTAARFAQALSMALSSGLTTDDALDTAGELLNGQLAAQQRVHVCRERMGQGESFAHALRDSGMFPAAECRLLELGFAGGDGESAMEEIARRLDREAEEALERTLGRVEPTMVVIASLLVGVILLSVMLPLTRIMTVLG